MWVNYTTITLQTTKAFRNKTKRLCCLQCYPTRLPFAISSGAGIVATSITGPLTGTRARTGTASACTIAGPGTQCAAIGSLGFTCKSSQTKAQNPQCWNYYFASLKKKIPPVYFVLMHSDQLLLRFSQKNLAGIKINLPGFSIFFYPLV